MATDFPFKTDYAKSGRSSCRTCHSTIEKGELRFAVMVQSRHHDGKDPLWHHVPCFFAKRKAPVAEVDIGGLGDLRWEDQEKLRAKCGGGGSGGAVATSASLIAGGGSSSSTKTNGSGGGGDSDEFSLVYAKSAATKCPICKDKIGKGQLAVLRKHGTKEKSHHLTCFADKRMEVGFGPTMEGRKMTGYKDLKKEDQAAVKEKLPATETKTDDDAASTSSSNNNDKKSADKKVNSNGTGSSAEELIKIHQKKLYENRDKLNKISRADVDALMEDNQQQVYVSPKTGVEGLFLRLADIMTFGKLLPCKKCSGQYIFKSGIGYECNGNFSEFAKCRDLTFEPEREPFKIPTWAAEKLEIFKDKKENKRMSLYPAKRCFQVVRQPGAAVPGTSSLKKLLEGVKLVVLEDTKHPEKVDKIREKVQALGATIVKNVTPSVVLVIANHEKTVHDDGMMKPAKKNKIPVVVASKFLDGIESASGGGGVSLGERIKSSLVGDWFKKEKVEGYLKEKRKEPGDKRTREEERFTVKDTVTMKMKGGAVVDPDSGLEDFCHVYKESGTYYNAIMNRIDVESGKNSFYKLQILQEDKKSSRFHVFRSWGRIGTTIGGQLIDGPIDLEEAKDLFCRHYAEKCGSTFGKPYKHTPGFYVPMIIDYQEEDKIKKKAAKPEDSKLPSPVQNLVTLIFDVEKMQDALIQFQINLEEMPLGKISGKQIRQAFTVLGDAQKLLEGPVPPEKPAIIDVTNRFFTYIPHSFGTATAPLLDNMDLIKKKTEMLESLLEIELAYEILQQDEGKEGVSPIDSHYAALKTDIEVLDPKSDEFGVIQTYLENTHAETHDAYELVIGDVFKINRMGESDRFEKFKSLHNRKLLWHGSRTTNFAGILSQGLRIAPPEAPVTGYMFGKGIYFADMVSKSANYCFASADGDSGLLLLCEVALGDMYELVNAKESLTKAPKDKHSVKGVGQTQPNPKSKYELTVDGRTIEVPYGKPQKYMGRQTSLLYNEYIVYDVAQVALRYLVRVEFKFKSKRRRH